MGPFPALGDPSLGRDLSTVAPGGRVRNQCLRHRCVGNLSYRSCCLKTEGDSPSDFSFHVRNGERRRTETRI